MKKTRILGIAPYEGMRTLMIQLAKEMEDVEMTAYVGDLETGASIVRQHAGDGFDVILSRGGTAELIRTQTWLPVVEIELSLYDLLRAMRLAEISNTSCALVGFPAITRNATYLCDVLNYRIELNTIHDEAEAQTVLQRLASEGCQMVLCDMITNSLAHEYGLPAILITSGSESVRNAIQHAVTINRSFYPLRRKTELLESVLAGSQEHLLVMDAEGNVLFQTDEAPAESLVVRCAEWVPSVLKDSARRFFFNAGGKQLHVTGSSVLAGQQRCVCFRIQAAGVRFSLEKYGIHYLSQEEVADHYFRGFYGVTQPGPFQLYEDYARKASPTIILGERGTGKEQMAQMLYSQGKYRGNPLCIIDCPLLQDKGWSYLMENESSLLLRDGNAVYFKHIDALTPERYQQLFSLLRDTNFHRRNQLLFTVAASSAEAMPDWVIQVAGWFNCSVITLPLLREHRDDIPHLATLYISSLNARNAREIASIDPDAIQMLKDYSWPANYDQFKRVLRDMVLETGGISVKADLVSRLLKKESLLYPDSAAESFGTAIQGKTMQEIELMAVRQALADAKGNRTAAAARLGISRTSLWRMIQEAQAE